MISPFPRSSILQAGILDGATDWHCHLLPGVDDGVQKLDATLTLLSYYEQVGIREVWLTPHVMEDYPNTPEDLRQRFATLQEAYEGPLRLHLASEHMLDNLFDQRLAANDVLPIGNAHDHLLVETSYFNPPLDLHDVLRRILAAGYYPLLAHPERYVYMERKDYRELIAMGVKFQVNLPSLAGSYGPHVQDKAQWLVSQGMATLLGTDTHQLGYLQRALNTPTRFIRKHAESLRKLAHSTLA